MFGICLLRTRVPTHFSAVHSVVGVCARNFCLLFKLLSKFREPKLFYLYSIFRKRTSSQLLRFFFAFKRNEAKHKELIHIQTTREQHPQKNWYHLWFGESQQKPKKCSSRENTCNHTPENIDLEQDGLFIFSKENSTLFCVT